MHVVERISEFATRTPDAPAIIADLQAISYRAFDRRIAGLRRALMARGAHAGAIAVVWIDSIPLAWAADLALRSQGLTSLAIRSEAELSGLTSLGVVALISSADEGPREGEALGPQVARIVISQDDLDEEDGTAPTLAAAPGDHILLTSATTGRYKMIRHTPAQDLKAYEEARPAYAVLVETPNRRVLVNYFNFGLWTAAAYGSSILIWSYGQTVVIHQGPDPHRTLTLPGLAYAVATPAFVARIMAAPPGSFPRNDNLQLSVLGGPLSARLFGEVRERLTHRITTSVGSTEAGTWATTEADSLDDLRWHRLVPGRVVEVVDDEDRPLPAGQLGQVRVKREDGADRYVGDPQASAAFFRGDFFYPGDLGVLDGKGRLALYGRVTDVLNVMGDKLPAAPVEQTLEEALGVTAVCAFSEQGGDLAEDLHIVIEAAVPLEEARLRAAADAHLRGFPRAHFHFVGALPRNAMGKIERLTLRRRIIEKRLASA